MFDPKTLTLEQIVKQMNAAVMRDEFKLLKHLCETAHSNFDVSVHNRDVISQHVNADAPEYQNVLLWASCLGNHKALEQYYTIERGQNVLQRVELSRDPNHCPEDDAFREVYPEHIEMLVEHHQLQVFRNKLHNSVAPHVDQKNPQPKSKI